MRRGGSVSAASPVTPINVLIDSGDCPRYRNRRCWRSTSIRGQYALGCGNWNRWCGWGTAVCPIRASGDVKASAESRESKPHNKNCDQSSFLQDLHCSSIERNLSVAGAGRHFLAMEKLVGNKSDRTILRFFA